MSPWPKQRQRAAWLEERRRLMRARGRTRRVIEVLEDGFAYTEPPAPPPPPQLPTHDWASPWWTPRYKPARDTRRPRTPMPEDHYGVSFGSLLHRNIEAMVDTDKAPSSELVPMPKVGAYQF